MKRYTATIIDCFTTKSPARSVLAASPAAASVAVPPGLAVQALMNPNACDAKRAFRLRQEILRNCIDEAKQPSAGL